MYYSAMTKKEIYTYIEYLPLVKPVLEQAIHDYLVYDNDTEEYKSAKEWLFEDDNDDFNFVEICETLNLDVNRLRYEINCLMDRKTFKNKYIANSDYSEIIENSEIEERILM